MNVIFDLDGTLSCCKQRIYSLFDNLVKESDISFESYWNLKYACLTNEDILRRYFCYSEQKIEEFNQKWFDLIETESFLRKDILFENVIPFLEEWSQKSNLYLCTARQFKHSTLHQLENFGILPFFKDILITEQKKTKSELIADAVKDLSVNDWIIGDTGHDIDTGKKLKIQTCAVLSGIMNEYNLHKYYPNQLISKVTDFNINTL